MRNFFKGTGVGGEWGFPSCLILLIGDNTWHVIGVQKISVNKQREEKVWGTVLKNRTKENPDTDRLKNPA